MRVVEGGVRVRVEGGGVRGEGEGVEKVCLTVFWRERGVVEGWEEEEEREEGGGREINSSVISPSNKSVTFIVYSHNNSFSIGRFFFVFDPFLSEKNRIFMGDSF